MANGTGYAAVVGDVQYKTLAEALEAAQAGGTVTLLDDVALDATLEISKNVTLELAGFTVTGNVIVQGDADVTFRGGVMTAVSGNSVIDVKGSAVLNLDGMTVDGGNALNVRSSIHAVVYESVGGLHITGSEILGGTLKHDENCGSIGTNSAAHAVYAYGSSGGSISIENSTLKGGNGKTDATYTGYVSQLFVGGNVALQLGGNAAVEIKNTTIHGGDSDWYNAADAINVSNTFDGTLSISGSSKISGGNALNGTGQNWGTGGQGIYTHQSTGCTQIDIRDSEITGGDGGGSWDGSGIELNKNVSTNIENSTIASGQGAAGGNAGSISINSRVSEVDVTLKDVTLNGDGNGNDVIKGATDGIKIAGEITIAGGTLEDVTFSEIETGTVIKTAGTGAVDVSSVTGTTSVPVFNEATGEYEFEPAAVSVNGKAYRTLAEAVAAAQDGDTVTVLGNISGETVTVDKNLTIVGTRTGEEYVGVLNDVIMNAGAGVTLSVKDLKFGGNSYVSAGSAAALNVEGCYADVTPSKITGRSAFIVTGTSEVSTGLLLTVKNNTIIASKGGNQAGDAYAAAIFGWSYLADGSEISGNTFGSETVPYNFIAVKTMNAMAGAVIKVGNNTIYGSNASFDFYAFDFFQNNSRANVYTVLLDGNAVTNTNAGTSENSFVFACVEANTGSFGPGHAQVLITGSNTQDGNVVALDQLDLTEGQYSYAGTGVTLDADGKITAGDFAGDLAAVLPALAADLFVTSDGVVQPIAAADVSTLYVNGEWAVTPDTVTGTILDDGKYYDINAYSSASDAFDSFTAETRNIELTGDQLLKTDFDDGGEWPKRNFDLALDGDLTLKAADGAESTLTLTVVDSQNSGGGSTNEVGELAFYSSSADQRATFTLEKGVTIDTNAKIWFGRPTQSSSSDTTPTDIVVNGNIIQQAHDGRYYGILQIQTEKDSTVLVNGSVAFGWTLSVRGAVFTVSSTGEVKASDPASTSSTILVDARSGVGGKFIVDGSKAVSAVVLDVDELGSFEMKNEAAAAFDTVDLAKNATLLVADGSTLTADAVTNAGTIQITGENGKLAVAEGGLTNKGAIVFGASDKTVNTTFDVGMLSKKAGSSAFNFQNGEVTFTGVMADGIRIQPFNVGRKSENVALDAASATVNIAAGAVVNAHQAYIAENYSANEHTLNVYGTLDVMTSIYNHQKGNLNVYGTVTGDYMQGAGNVLVSGKDATLNLAGAGSNGSLQIGRTGRTFRIADGGTVIAGGKVQIGYSAYNGTVEITGGGRLEAQSIAVNGRSTLTLDHTASLSFRSITKAANATITVDLSGYTDQFALLIENTGSDATDYAGLISNWNELEAAGCMVVGNDLFLGKADMSVFRVNTAWLGEMSLGEEVGAGFYYGVNAFGSVGELPTDLEGKTLEFAAGNTTAYGTVNFSKPVTITTYGEGYADFGGAAGATVIVFKASGKSTIAAGSRLTAASLTSSEVLTRGELSIAGEVILGKQDTEEAGGLVGNLWNKSIAGGTLTIEQGGSLTVHGQISNRGTIVVKGELVRTVVYGGGAAGLAGVHTQSYAGKFIIDGGVVRTYASPKAPGGENSLSSGVQIGANTGTSKSVFEMKNNGRMEVEGTLFLGANCVGTIADSTLKADAVENSGTVTVSGTSTLNIGSVTANMIQTAAGTTLKDSAIGGSLRVLGDLTVDGELSLGNGGIWCGYNENTPTTATISGGMITAKYAMFQYGTYVISADMTLDYGYLSYGGTFTVNSTIKASGQSGEPFYVRGDVTLADGGKLLIDKALWLDYEGAVLTVADGAAVEAGGLKLIADTSMNVNGGSVKVGNTLENNGTFTVSGASTLNIGKLTGNMLQVVADTTLTDSVIGGNVSVGFNAENAADTTLTLAGDTSIGTLYVGKENRTNDYKLVIAGEETTVKLGSLYSRTGSTTTISNGATLDISNYWQSKGTVTVDASTINHSGVNFYVYNNDSADTAAIALMNGAVLNHINAYSLTLGSTTETVSGVAKGNASVTLEGGSTLNVNRLYLNATGTVEEVAGAEAKTSLTAVDSTVTARGEVGIGAGATVSLGNSAFTANTLISSGAIVMDSLSTITCAGAFTSTGTITARVDAAQSGVSFVQKLINASTLTVNDSLTVEGGREGAQLVATGNALWLDNSDKSTILINSEYAGEVGSAIAGRDGYFFGFNALTEYSTSIGADSAVEFTGGSYSFADGFSFTGREFTVSGDTSFDKVTGGSVAVTGGTLSIDTVELTADIAALSGALLAFSGNGMADLANLVLTVSGTMANRTKYVLATGVKDDSFAITLNGETYELNVRKDGLLVGVENGELYVQKSDDWFMLSRDLVQTVLPEDGYAFGGSDMYESAVMSVERDLNVATNGQNAGARVYGGGLLRNDALFSGTQKCEVTVTAGGVGKGVIGGNRVESGSIGGTLTSSVTIDSADGTFGFIVGGNQLTGGELNGFGGTSVTIQNGTFSMWISGGSVAGGDAAAQVMGNTNVTITGGTFNGTGVFGGGFVQENGTLNQVGNTNVTISGGTFAGNIYGGHGATNKDASPNGVLFGNTNITISGGIFNGNIYGGGFDQSKVQGDTHITFTGTAGADFSVNGIIDGDASNARYWSKGSFVTGDRYLTFDAFSGEFGATLITNIDQMEVTGGSDVNLKNQLDLSEVSQWEFDFGSSLEGFAQNDLAGDSLVLSGWEDQLGDEGWTVMSGSSITGFGEMEVTNGSNLIFAWNADEQYYLGSIGDEQFKLSMEDGAMKLAKLA